MTQNLNPFLGWTDANCLMLTQMWTDGVSGGDIAKALGLGCTKNMVIGKANRLKLTARKARKVYEPAA